METFVILIKLLCAHLCADFIFQTDCINNGKRKQGANGIVYLLVHALTHGLATYLLLAEWSGWFIPLAIFVSHFITDWIKCRFCKNTLPTFLADQFVHIAIIAILWYAFYGTEIKIPNLAETVSTKVWLTIAAYILMLRPSSIFLNLFLDKWTPASPNTQSLPNAGKWIGYIERILILTFILVGSLESVGFLLAAKSVFRFGELNKAKEIRTTEYVLIGTFASFTIAILAGIAITRLF